MNRTVRRGIHVALGVLAALLLSPAPVYAVDSVRFAVGTGDTTVIRFGLAWDWDRRWELWGNHNLGGYWELSAERWRLDNYNGAPGQKKSLYGLGITPVFRIQREAHNGPYLEFGIGIRFFSDVYHNGHRQLSTRFQFSDHIAVGYQFAEGLDVGLKFQHVSNGGISAPNDGVNTTMLQVAYRY